MPVAVVAGRIRRRAAAVDPATVLLVLLAALPFLAGWLARQVWRVVWLVLAHAGSAVVEGWQAAAKRGAP
jgi:hypothetical protein